MRPLLLALLALPLAADPLFKLYDCKGQESACTGMFPGSAAPFEDSAQYIQGDRLVVNGIDLGLSRVLGEVSYSVIYNRDPWIIGWEFCCDGAHDGDASLVRWFLDGGTATLYRGPGGAIIADASSSGHVIGAAPGFGAFYDEHGFGPDNFQDYDLWASRIAYFDEGRITLLRINDAGQALGSAAFWTFSPDPNAPATEERLFLLSPADNLPRGLHSPEPSFAVLLGGLLVCLCASRRWQMRQRPCSERGAVRDGIARSA